MSFVGKILTVLVLVMSVTFATMAVMVYATHVNYRDEVKRAASNKQGKPAGLEVRFQQLTKERDTLALQLTRLKEAIDKERQGIDEKIAQLESQIKDSEQKRVDLEKERRDLNVLKTEAVATLKITQDTLAQKEEQNQTLREDIRIANEERREAFDRIREITVDVLDLQTTKERLEARNSELAVDRNRILNLLRVNGINPNTDPAAVLPKVDGEVRAVLPDGLIEISIGSDDALKKRDQLQVYRLAGGQSRYLGRVEVIKTAPDVAVCKILPNYRSTAGAIQAQDRVTSQLE
ncbi:MAG: hypothetical protein JW818_04890 [Pirellulales bacterium]|nr:hypothetical protein [Pirellulales bacterium]